MFSPNVHQFQHSYNRIYSAIKTNVEILSVLQWKNIQEILLNEKKKKTGQRKGYIIYPLFYSEVLERAYVLVFPYICIEWVTSVHEGRRLFTEPFYIFKISEPRKYI